MWKDFDIRKEAGSSFRALSKEFKVRVSENYLEIHLFWLEKGHVVYQIKVHTGLLFLQSVPHQVIYCFT